MNRSNCNMRQGNACRMNRQTPSSASACCNPINHSDYKELDRLPAAMAYVPFTSFDKTYDLCHALKTGTLFPELYKPFCGKGGGVCL